jgi:hypothetical protein
VKRWQAFTGEQAVLDGGTREAYVAKVKAAAEALVADRLVLPSDAAGYVKAAEQCDRF